MQNRKRLHLCGEYITYSDQNHAVGFYYVVNGKAGIHVYAKNKKYEAAVREQFTELSKRIPVDDDHDYEWRDLLSDLKNQLRQIQVQPLEADGEWLGETGDSDNTGGLKTEIHPESVIEYELASCVGPQPQD